MPTTTLPSSPHDRPTAEPIDRGRGVRRRAARLAGWGYVSLFLLAIFANFTVVERLVVADDALATLANVEGSLLWLRLGIVAFLAVFIIDVGVAWALHLVFRDHDHDRSLLAAWCRLVYTVFLGVSLVFLFRVLFVVDGAGAGLLDRSARASEVAMAFDAFDATWLIGLAVFGIHLVVLGSLVVTSGAAPRALGLVMMVAGLAYVIDTACRALVPDYEAVAALLLALVAIPSVIGEGWFGLWLLVRAGHSTKLEDRRIARATPAGRD